MLSVPQAKRTPEARCRGKFSLTTRRDQRTLSMMAARWPSPCSIPVGCMKIANVQISQTPRSIISAMSSSVASAPCSIVRTPSRTASCRPGPPCACAAA